MKTILLYGSVIVTLALVSYSIAFFKFHRIKKISKQVLIIQSLALLLDVTATSMMIIGSENSPFTLHGLVGYSALFVMIFDTFFFWNRRSLENPGWLLRFSTFAYIWWVLAYLTGTYIAMSH
jgi:hypothetical protein